MVSIRAPLLLVAAAVAALCTSSSVSAAHVHPSVHRTLRSQGTVNFIVSFMGSTEAVLNSAKEVAYASRGAKITSFVNQLEAHASKSQAAMKEMLSEARPLPTEAADGDGDASTPLFKSKKSFWISNQVSFEAAAFNLMEKLSSLESVSQVQEDIVFPMPAVTTLPTNSSDTEAVGLLANQWAVIKVGAPDLWARSTAESSARTVL